LQEATAQDTAEPASGLNPLAAHSLAPTELKRVLAAEREGRPFLAFRTGAGELRLTPLEGSDETLTLGRGDSVDIALPWDAQVSALHAELECIAGGWAIVDDGLSRNGTFVNGQRVHARQRLRGGDLVRIGRTMIAFSAHSAASPGTTVTTGELPALPELTAMQRRVLVALCRPYRDGEHFATPASNQQIADEVFLSLVAVKMHLRALFNKLGLSDLPQNQKRARLVEYALQLGLVDPRELE
jgi:pSer/pThr/pTyr-binding forkhead associated (FHA) protein/DNA-binding CsgD family transcriptional regulator